jgi:hypothetical protein
LVFSDQGRGSNNQKIGVKMSFAILVPKKSGASCYKSLYHVFSGKGRDENEVEIDDRVVDVFGDLKGCGAPNLHQNQMTKALTFNQEGLRGNRKIRNFLLSCTDETDLGKRDELVPKVKVAVHDFIRKFFPSARWLAVTHADRNHVHAHIVVANFDEQKDRRYNVSEKKYDQMLGLTWTNQFERGRSNKQKDPNYPLHNARSKLIGQLKNNHVSRREKAMQDLRELLLRETWPSLVSRGLIVERRKRKNGGDLNQPSFVFDGQKIRFEKWEKFLGESEPSATKINIPIAEAGSLLPKIKPLKSVDLSSINELVKAAQNQSILKNKIRNGGRER